MPNYNAQAPPYSVNPGDVALAFNREAPATGQARQQFALPCYTGFPANNRVGHVADHLWFGAFDGPRGATSVDGGCGLPVCDGRHLYRDGGRVADSCERARKLRTGERVFDHRRIGRRCAVPRLTNSSGF
jgi:hypothetical protein